MKGSGDTSRNQDLIRLLPFIFLFTLLAACSGDRAENSPFPETKSAAGSSQLDGTAQNPDPISNPTPLAEQTSAVETASLTGQILFLTFVEAKAALVSFNLETEEQSVIFEFPQNSWLTHFAVSPDYSQIVLSYLPPANWGGRPVVESSIFTLTLDGSSEPQLLLAAETPDVAYHTPAWSADGTYIYYSSMTRTDADDHTAALYNLERIHLANGAIDSLVNQAIWPALSPDDQLMAYLTVEVDSTDNYLFVSDTLGSNQQPALDPDAFKAVDAQIFSSDSAWIYFSGAVEPEPLSRSLLDVFSGAKPVRAHNFPADWWRVAVAGGQLEKLTDISEVGLSGTFSPDGAHLAFVTSQGLYVMRSDGSDLSQILRTVTFGSVAWLP